MIKKLSLPCGGGSLIWKGAAVMERLWRASPPPRS
jgi:hypothetical protein